MIDDIKENIQHVKDTIAVASQGRSIELIAVSKFVEASRIMKAVEYGIHSFGENYPQELVSKFESVPNVSWHMIGQMQKNKVKYIIGKVCLIQSVDRDSLAAEINRRAAAIGLEQSVLIQVNVGREPQKGGIFPEQLDPFLETMSGYENIRVRGLMAIPPNDTMPEKWFAEMRELFDRFRSKDSRILMDTLSMGMSHDYEIAIRYGATMVRVGTAIFGKRPLKQ